MFLGLLVVLLSGYYCYAPELVRFFAPGLTAELLPWNCSAFGSLPTFFLPFSFSLSLSLFLPLSLFLCISLPVFFSLSTFLSLCIFLSLYFFLSLSLSLSLSFFWTVGDISPKLLRILRMSCCGFCFWVADSVRLFFKATADLAPGSIVLLGRCGFDASPATDVLLSTVSLSLSHSLSPSTSLSLFLSLFSFSLSVAVGDIAPELLWICEWAAADPADSCDMLLRILFLGCGLCPAVLGLLWTWPLGLLSTWVETDLALGRRRMSCSRLPLPLFISLPHSLLLSLSLSLSLSVTFDDITPELLRICEWAAADSADFLRYAAADFVSGLRTLPGCFSVAADLAPGSIEPLGRCGFGAWLVADVLLSTVTVTELCLYDFSLIDPLTHVLVLCMSPMILGILTVYTYRLTLIFCTDLIIVTIALTKLTGIQFSR